MSVFDFQQELPADHSAEMQEFEKEFRYCLGENSYFHISHGEDYLSFFRAMGVCHLILSMEHGKIEGSLVVVARNVLQDGRLISCHYLCDLKIRSDRRGRTALAKMFLQAKRVIERSETTRCFCVVMKGTQSLPVSYTGRIGVPKFREIAEVLILRFTGASPTLDGGNADLVEEKEYRAIRQTFTSLGVQTIMGDPTLRSEMRPLRLVSSDKQACGILENTRKGKRLLLDDGEEIVSAHLSDFNYSDVSSAAVLLRDAFKLCESQGIPAFFVALPVQRWNEWSPVLALFEFTVSRASIYGHGFPVEQEWWINTAEI